MLNLLASVKSGIKSTFGLGKAKSSIVPVTKKEVYLGAGAKSIVTSDRNAQPKSVRFAFRAPQAKIVQLVGTFNKWDVNAVAMQRDMNGLWTISVPLKPGRYDFRFLVDGVWTTDKAAQTSANPFGGLNNTIEVP